MQDAFAYCAELVRPPTATASSLRCSRRRSSAARCTRSMPSMSKWRGCATWRASRCPAKSACNGGATSSIGERDGEARPIRLPLHCLPPSSGIGLARRHADRSDRCAPFDLYDDPMARACRSRNVCAKDILLAYSLSRRKSSQASRLTRSPGLPVSLPALPAMLRAFPLHVARRQIYVPMEILDRHGVHSHDLFAGRSSAGLVAALTELRNLARRHLRVPRARA